MATKTAKIEPKDVDVSPNAGRHQAIRWIVSIGTMLPALLVSIFLPIPFYFPFGVALVACMILISLFKAWGEWITIKGKKGQEAYAIYATLDPYRRSEARMILKTLVEIENDSKFSSRERAAVSERLAAIIFLKDEQTREIREAAAKAITESDLLAIRARGFTYKPEPDPAKKVARTYRGV